MKSSGNGLVKLTRVNAGFGDQLRTVCVWNQKEN